MNSMIGIGICLLAALCTSCRQELIEYGQGDLRISIEKGDAYLHDFPLFLGISKKNAPQMAVWTEDMQGNFLSTIYVTRKIATQSWTASGGNRRKEALPCWCHVHGVRYDDGLYLPTKAEPLTDGVSGATPREDFDVKITPKEGLKRFVVKIEINHSTDFNEFYPASAREGDANYSGGKMGSGQPAVVYAATVDLSSGQHEFPAVLIGHSSPDGSDGSVDPDLSTLTSALHIVKGIVIRTRP